MNEKVILCTWANPWIHSSKNSKVSLGSFLANVSDTLLMNIVLFEGMQTPLVSSRWPSILRSNVEVRAQSRLYAAVRRWGSLDPRFRRAMLSRVPGTSLGRIFWWTVSGAVTRYNHLHIIVDLKNRLFWDISKKAQAKKLQPENNQANLSKVQYFAN